jgi:hypothetical protein
MPGSLIALLLLGATGLGFGLGILRARKARRVFEQAADLLGLPRSEIRGWLHMRVEGHSRTFPVQVREEGRGKSGVWTVVEVKTCGRVPDSLFLGREGIGASFGKLFVGEDIATGDERFDAAVVVRGPASRALALLDEETRHRVTELVRAGGKVKDGVVSIALHRRFRDGEALSGFVQQLVAVAERLAQPDPTVERLAALARFDAVSGTRHRCLQELIGSHSGDPLTDMALRSALADRTPEVRLLAAVALGDAGLDCLREIVASGGTSPEVARSAVEALGERLPEEVALARLEMAVRAGHERLVRVLVERFGPSTSRQGVARLARQLRDDAPAETAAACARALGRTGSAVAAPPLVAALARNDAGVRAAAAEALGKVGTVESIAALREAASGNLMSPSVRRAAAAAIAEIQSRLTGAAPGQLALSRGEVGSLALADRAEGDLALVGLPEPEPGSTPTRRTEVETADPPSAPSAQPPRRSSLLE